MPGRSWCYVFLGKLITFMSTDSGLTRGFSLVEILVAVAIIGILASVTVPLPVVNAPALIVSCTDPTCTRTVAFPAPKLNPGTLNVPA